MPLGGCGWGPLSLGDDVEVQVSRGDLVRADFGVLEIDDAHAVLDLHALLLHVGVREGDCLDGDEHRYICAPPRGC